MKSISCLHLLTFRSLAVISSEKILFLLLTIEKPNKNIKMSSFNSSENIIKKDGGPDRSVSDNQSSQ